MGHTKDKKSEIESETARQQSGKKQRKMEGRGSTKRIGTRRGQTGKEIRDQERELEGQRKDRQ